MTTAGKSLLAMLGNLFTPVVQGTISNAQIARNLDHRLATGFCKLNRFYFKLSCKCPLFLPRGLCPFSGKSTLSSLASPFFWVKTKSTIGNFCEQTDSSGEISRCATSFFHVDRRVILR